MSDLRPDEPRPSRENLKVAEAVELSRRIVEATSLERPLGEALRALVEELPSGASRRIAARLADQVDRGTPLETLFETHANRFPGPLRGLVRAGLRTGKLAETLAAYVDSVEKERTIVRGIRSKLIYPSLLLAFALIVGLGLFKWVVPTYAKVFDDLDFRTSLPLKILISGSNGLNSLELSAIFRVLAAGAVYLAILTILKKAGLIRSAWGTDLPFRSLRRWLALSEFSSLIALLLESGVPADESLLLTSESARTVEMRKATALAAAEVADGGTIAKAIGRALPFGKSQLGLIAWAEAAGLLPQTFRLLAETFDARALVQARKLSSFWTIFTFVLVLWSIGLVVSTLIFTLFAMMAGLSGLSPPNGPPTWEDWLLDFRDWFVPIWKRIWGYS